MTKPTYNSNLYSLYKECDFVKVSPFYLIFVIPFYFSLSTREKQHSHFYFFSQKRRIPMFRYLFFQAVVSTHLTYQFTGFMQRASVRHTLTCQFTEFMLRIKLIPHCKNQTLRSNNTMDTSPQQIDRLGMFKWM